MSVVPETPDTDPVVQRLAQLELTLLELVTTLGLLVSDVANRVDVQLEPELVDRALLRAWETLFDEQRPGAPPRRDVVRDWSHPERLAKVAPVALREAIADTGAAVGAVYGVDDDEAWLAAFEGYPPEVIERFDRFSLDAALPVAAAARSRRPLWFAARTQIVDRYPHLREAHEETEQRLGLADVQGAVVPLLARDRVGAVVTLGFDRAGAPRGLDHVRARIVRAVTTANAVE